MPIDIKTQPGPDSSRQMIAMLEAELLKPGLQPEERMAAGLMLEIARVYLPWFDRQHALAQEDLTLSPMILNSVCNCAATMLGIAVTNLIAVNPLAFQFIMTQFGKDLAHVCNLHIEEVDGDEPVAIAGRPGLNS